jgi:kumamolisin
MYFPTPAYQVAALQGHTPAGLANSALINNRSIPDVALNADPLFGWGIRFNNAWTTVGGTSAVSPAVSAFLGLVNKTTFTNYVNAHTQFYANAAYFTDVLGGASIDSLGLGAAYYLPKPGYDQCTGLGAINGTALVSRL